MAGPLILYIPGLKPKPEPGVHGRQLLRCLQAGLARADAAAARAIARADDPFDLVSWTYDFYGEHRPFELDRASVDAVIAEPVATEADREEARSLRRRVLRRLYRLGDRLPFLIPHLADENLALHLRDLRRYAKNENDIAENTRRHLKVALRGAAAARRPVLLLAHSMGSVIAWDALWQLGRDPEFRGRVSLFMTLGSPLGQHTIRRRLLGARRSGDERWPQAIDRWLNVAAVGELTALYANLAEIYGEMQASGAVAGIEDIEIYNAYRDRGALNVHAEYGYLANPDVAARVAAWWHAQ